MDQRGSVRVAGRQPLGDATQRVNNATIAKVSRQHRLDKGENDDGLSKPMKTVRGRSNPALASNHAPAEKHTGKARVAANMAEAAPAVNPRLSAIAQDSRDATDSRRASQFSNVSSNASSTRQLKTHIGPWQLGKTLGKGSSARVRLARHRVSHQLVAVKIVAKSTAHMNQAGSLANLDRIDYRNPTTSADGGVRRMPLAIEREVAILKLIQHPNIIKLHDIWENRSEIYLVTEYVEKGDMFEFINYNGRLHEEESIWYFRQIMSALEYCHSFNICHRDLKPENILLKGNGQVKIADFGMAALHQGPSHQLKTACGSPHYAAPELLRHHPYKGPAVDIWSMGVILFAMLSGRLPFDNDDLNVMLMHAKNCQYTMPSDLSREAKDLIRRILVAQPAHRITMKQMWRHALIKKYDYMDKHQEWIDQAQNGRQDVDTRPIPEMEVDPQLLRQLKSMWHTFSDTDLRAKLADPKPNDQKMFYWLLYNHREAQLENYNNDVPVSKSDFHHLKPPNWGKRISTCEFTQTGRSGNPRSVSRFTVISNVAEMDEVGTVRSYDPFNSSQYLQPYGPQASHARIVVHRNSNSPEPGAGPVPTTVSHSYHSYKSIGGSFRQRRMNSQRTNTTGHLRSPRGSLGSIRSHQSTPRVRASTRSKRGVDFSNVRNKDRHRRRSRDVHHGPPVSMADTRTIQARDSLSPSRRQRSRRHGGRDSRTKVETGKPREDSMIWNEELQQLSHRIAKDCDEAFQSSIMVSDSVAEVGDSREASPFSLSLGTPSLSHFPFPDPPSTAPIYAQHQTGAYPWENRPLPPVPSDDGSIPGPCQGRKDTEAVLRRQTYSTSSKASNAVAPERRTVSEPLYSQTLRDVRPLPPICESTSEERGRNNFGKNRAVLTSPDTPSPAEGRGLDFLVKAENTIRIVNSPGTDRADHYVEIPEPLNVRKVSRAPPAAAKSTHSLSAEHTQRQVANEVHQKNRSVDEATIDAPVAAKKRVSSWFKRSSKEDVGDSSFVTVTEKSVRSGEMSFDMNTIQSQRRDSQGEKKKAFSFSFWKGSKNESKMSIAGPGFDDDQGAQGNVYSRPKADKGEGRTSSTMWNDNEAGVRQIEVRQNWLARLFRVKPAMRHLCLAIPKVRARQFIANMLKEWRQYGVRIVEVDKERNMIFARVLAKNYLGLKEVSFAVEVMTVIEHGKRNLLSIARFTQEKGAASTFHKTVDEINMEFATRGLTVTDKRKINMMIKTLNS
ncbi:hypothetical protein B0T19DRAFT_364263 [Cercophora scortea]|uniref:non-specific serine/threonine protein kinase n=1 Tax=Cercophora scortea TaxID=314031 RepID=A0AAE0J2I2_9PEZI|nr:hypothetical protein B0T19DRAFT_364263 [Cercophora scortea]